MGRYYCIFVRGVVMTTKPPKSTGQSRQAMREERMKKERQRRTRLILLIAGSAVAVLVLVLAVRYFTQPSVGNIVTVESNSRPQVDGNNMGDPNAPVKIVNFSDFQCPYCKQFADETEDQIVENYVKTGKVYFTFRSMGNFISDNIRQGKTESIDAAMGAYCAGDQGKFWEYKDALFANWQGEDAGSFTRARLDAIAESLGLDVDQFGTCMDDDTHRDRALKDAQDGFAAGVTGTPAFLINGKLLTGALPFTEFAKEIEIALQAAGN
jgi:protein-disulfide isomerase